MRLTGVIMKAGPRPDGDVITQEALEAALPSIAALPDVYRAWIEGDELRIEYEAPDDTLPRIFGKPIRP